MLCIYHLHSGKELHAGNYSQEAHNSRKQPHIHHFGSGMVSQLGNHLQVALDQYKGQHWPHRSLSRDICNLQTQGNQYAR